MFNLVVLSALFAVAASEPSAVFASPYAYTSTFYSPSTTTITKQASSVLHPSPLVYSSPLSYTHFIKKRSAPLALSPYFAPTTYLAAAPLAQTYSTSLIGSPILPTVPLTYAAPAHLIKKRSAALALPTTYTTTAYSAHAPLLATSYAAPVSYFSTPLISSAPFGYSHLIKKRSAPLALSTYAAYPSSYSQQSRIDFTHSSPLITSYSTPYVY